MELVIVPLHRRPAMALACLTRLRMAGHKDQSLHFYLAIDANPLPEVIRVAEQFAEEMGHQRTTIIKRTRTFRGNSYNVLSAYADTYDCGAEMIHLVEEDVLVGNDYFTYHRQVREQAPGAFSVCACRNQFWPLDNNPPAEEDAFYLQTCYQSIGVSFLPEHLKYVVPHANQAFYTNPGHYVRKHFPNSPLGMQYLEQDGLIYRIILDGQWVSAFPCVPRSYHVGFYGYNRGGKPLPGSTAQQAMKILSMKDDELNARAVAYRDYETIDLDADRAPITRTLTWF